MSDEQDINVRITDYATVARSTAIYPESARFFYPALGLCGETGEVCDRMIPQSGRKISIPLAPIIKEMGDVLWYITNTAMDIGFTLQDIAEGVTGGLRCDTFEDMAFQRLKRRDRRSPFLKFSVYSGQIAEVAKKGLRDGYGTKLSPVKRAAVHMALVELMAGLCEFCEKFGISMDEVAYENNKKLTDRKKRDKLKGDGDDR